MSATALSREECYPTTASSPTLSRNPAQHHESADDYPYVVARLSPRCRVIVCKDGIQWILQRYDGMRCGQARWAGAKYFVTREALLRAGRALNDGIAPDALAILEELPEHIGRARS
jgi:hypothetical protein